MLSSACLTEQMKYYYDLHIHTCLSPCGDDDMTPFNIANMAKLKGLDVIAVTDHNSCKNAAAVAKAAKGLDLLVMAGMELTTREDVHVLTLFPGVENALAFDEFVSKKRLRIKNKPQIYGRQLIMDENDNVTGEEGDLLLTSADIGVYETVALAQRFKGVALPAHIDRDSNGIVAILGDVSKDMGFSSVEFSANVKDGFMDKYIEQGYRRIIDSDAHYLENINERQNNFLQLETLSASAIINVLQGK